MLTDYEKNKFIREIEAVAEIYFNLIGSWYEEASVAYEDYDPNDTPAGQAIANGIEEKDFSLFFESGELEYRTFEELSSEVIWLYHWGQKRYMSMSLLDCWEVESESIVG